MRKQASKDEGQMRGRRRMGVTNRELRGEERNQEVGENERLGKKEGEM